MIEIVARQWEKSRRVSCVTFKRRNLLFILFAAGPALAAEVVLPKFIGPHILAWDDPNPPDAGVTAYHVYYRLPGATWDDTRMATVTAPTRTFELLSITTIQGTYEIAVSAVTATAESGMSATVPFEWRLPSSPTNLRKQ